MGKGKRKGNNGKPMGDDNGDMGNNCSGDGVPPPAPHIDHGKLADEVAMLRALNARVIAELLEARVLVAKQSPVGGDDNDGMQQHDGASVQLPDAVVKEPHLRGATVQERPDLGKGAVSEVPDVAALPVFSEVSDALSAVVDAEESEEESPPVGKLKYKSMADLYKYKQSLERQGKAAREDAGVDTSEVHVAGTDSEEEEEEASLRARLAAAEERAARLEAANAEKLQALAEAKAASERVAELEKQLGEMNLSVLESEGKTIIGKKKEKKKAPGARARQPQKPVTEHHGGKGEGTSEAGPEVDAGQARGGRPRRTVRPNTKYAPSQYVVYGDAPLALLGRSRGE